MPPAAKPPRERRLRPSRLAGRARVVDNPPRAQGGARRTATEVQDLLVRTATLADLDTVVTLRVALVREEMHRLGIRTSTHAMTRRGREIYALQLASTDEVTFLAFDGAKGVGVLRCTISGDSSPARASRYAFLTSGYVVASYRRRGVLRTLVQHADVWCRSRALREMRLQVQWDNRVGNAAWEALGFFPLEIRRRRIVPTD